MGRYAKMDEIWIHQYTLESNRPTAGIAPGEPHPNRPKKPYSCQGPYFGMHHEFCVSTSLTKIRHSLATVPCPYWYVWRRQKWFCTKTMHRAKYIHRISQIWYPETFICLQTSKEILAGERFGSNEEMTTETKLELVLFLKQTV